MKACNLCRDISPLSLWPPINSRPDDGTEDVVRRDDQQDSGDGWWWRGMRWWLFEPDEWLARTASKRDVVIAAWNVPSWRLLFSSRTWRFVVAGSGERVLSPLSGTLFLFFDLCFISFFHMRPRLLLRESKNRASRREMYRGTEMGFAAVVEGGFQSIKYTDVRVLREMFVSRDGSWSFEFFVFFLLLIQQSGRRGRCRYIVDGDVDYRYRQGGFSSFF